MFRPKILLLGPGGSKGYLELGSLLYLEQHKILEHCDTFIGVSIGAVISLLLTCGYSSTEIIERSLSLDFSKELVALKLEDIIQGIGVFSNDSIKNALIRAVTDKFGTVLNLQQLYLATGRKLICTTMNFDRHRVEYISKDNEPDLSCVDAVLLSINIPFLFRTIKHKGCMYIDGGIGNPYPIDIIDDTKTDILGLYIDTKVNSNTKDGVMVYLQGLVTSFMSKIRENHIQRSSPKCHHIGLSTEAQMPGAGAIGLGVNKEAKFKMISDGFQTTKNYFENLSKDRYLVPPHVETEISKFVDTLDPRALSTLIRLANDRISRNRRETITENDGELHILNMLPSEESQLFRNGKITE